MKLSSNFFQKGGLGDTTKNKKIRLKRTKIKLEILGFVSERWILFTVSVYTLAKFTKDTNPLFWAFRVYRYLKGWQDEKNQKSWENYSKKFFVNEQEAERIKLIMKETGITNFSIFARRACCNKEIFSIDFSDYKNIISEISATKSELKRIGNNINQIAKHLNENKNNQTKELMSNYQNQLENLEEKIQEVVHYISEG